MPNAISHLSAANIVSLTAEMNAGFANGRAGRILIVDDDPIMHEVLARTLATEGHTLETASDGREALVLFENDKFDLVILDYEMPDMKGDELALIINALAPDQRLLMITAYPERLGPNLVLDVDDVIRKPFDPALVRSVTSRLMHQQHGFCDLRVGAR